MTTPEIIDFLSREQTRQNISDIELLKTVKISRTTLWRMRTGATPATGEQLSQIANALGWEINLKKVSK